MIHRLVLAAFGLLTAEAIFATPYLSGELLLGTDASPLLIGASLLLFLAIVVTLWRFHGHLTARLARITAALIRVPTPLWILGIIVLGVVARLVWILLFPAPVLSDSRTYYGLAGELLAGQEYRDPRGDYAYWPPGYPFILYAFMRLLGRGEWIVVLVGITSYAACVPLVHALGSRLGGVRTARLATLLLALWPNYTFSIPGKEIPSATLVTVAVVAYVYSSRLGRLSLETAALVLGGAALALASLSQPGILLLAVLIPIYDVLRRAPIHRAIFRSGVLLMVLGVCVGLWTARNTRVLGEPVLIATNGGDVFYRANNPLATGGYVEEGERSLAGVSELDRSRLGFQWGMEWIRAHPMEFLGLALRKQVLFLGDDSGGVYWTLKVGLSITDIRYLALKALASAYWLLLWLLIALGLIRYRQEGLPDAALVSLLMLVVCYLYAVASVFESGGRHHMPAVGVLAVLATLALGRPSHAGTSTE